MQGKPSLLGVLLVLMTLPGALPAGRCRLDRLAGFANGHSGNVHLAIDAEVDCPIGCNQRFTEYLLQTGRLQQSH